MSSAATPGKQPSRTPLPPAGHYSSVAWIGDIAYVSGQLPIDRSGHPLAGSSFADQVSQVLENLEVCLESAGLSPRDLVQVRVYVTDIADWPQFDSIYRAWIGEHRPTRAVVGVNQLHYGAALEIEAIASRASVRTDPGART